jgi:predicted PhzF superfamily epimerase YddE/YHI9
VPTLRYVIVDVFTDRALAGNQLTVFTDGRGVDGETMQALARESGFNALANLEVMANCIAGAGTSWKARMFAPSDGRPEDPATGSAAGPHACHVCRHGLVPWGIEIEISQGEEIGRPSTLYARADGSDAGIERVEVGGRAVVVAHGEFRLGQLVAG